MIALVDTARITTRFDNHSRTATVRIRHIEPITELADVEALDRLLRTALKRRTGSADLPDMLDQPTLPFDSDEED